MSDTDTPDDFDEPRLDAIEGELDDLHTRLCVLEAIPDLAVIVQRLKDDTGNGIYILRIKRTTKPDNPPPSLATGEFGIELAEPRRLWIGVPSDIDPEQKLMLIDFTAYEKLVERVNELEKALIR